MNNVIFSAEPITTHMKGRQTSTNEKKYRPRKQNIMRNLFKAYYGDENKYSVTKTDNFERKFMLFPERCDQADSPNEDCNQAF